MRRGKRPKWMIDIAKERMEILFSNAKQEFHMYPKRSHRYVVLATKISKKYNTEIPKQWKRSYCKKCNKFMLVGNNCSVRVYNGIIKINCLECGNIVKIPYIKEKKEKRRSKIECNSKKRINEKIP
ncbi:MAG: ribonuclease P protein component 4 [Methanobacteriaceae archaeon]